MLVNNINANMYKIIFNMYENIKSYLFKNVKQSGYFPYEIGVHQVVNLLPFLFS